MLQARQFEGFIAALVEQLGFNDLILTPRSGDDGRDVLATKRVHGIPIMRDDLSWAYTRASKGVLVTTSHFTPSARNFILTEPDLLRDIADVKRLREENGPNLVNQGSTEPVHALVANDLVDAMSAGCFRFLIPGNHAISQSRNPSLESDEKRPLD